MKRDIKALKEVTKQLEIATYSSDEVKSYQNVPELKILEYFTKFNQLSRQKELFDHLGADQIQDFKPKVASLLSRADFYDNLVATAGTKANPILDTIKSVDFKAQESSQENLVIMRTLTGIIFDKWDPDRKNYHSDESKNIFGDIVENHDLVNTE